MLNVLEEPFEFSISTCPRLNLKSWVFYPGSGFLASATCPLMLKEL